MIRTLARPIAPILALAALACTESPTEPPPDTAACATIEATFTVVSPPVTFSEVGTLVDGACVIGRGTNAQRWELVLPAAVRVRINLNSDDFDAYLVLRNSDDDQIASNDDNIPGTNSELDGIMQPGTYYIMATTYEDGEIGDYSLSVDVTALPIDVVARPGR